MQVVMKEISDTIVIDPSHQSFSATALQRALGSLTDTAVMAASYRTHNAAVRTTIPSKQLLVVDVNDEGSLGALCEFLKASTGPCAEPESHPLAARSPREPHSRTLIDWLGSIPPLSLLDEVAVWLV
jgi:hypothetical protein